MKNTLKNTFLSQTMSKMYLSDDFSDFTFTFQDKKLPVHKNILATASPVFSAMFFGPIKDNNTVEIVDSNIEAFKEFLQFFYLDEVILTMENIEEVVILADKYDMIDCLKTCVAFVEDKLDADNILWGYKLAIALENEKLKKLCEKYICVYQGDIFKSIAFLHCDHSLLKNILQMDKLACDEGGIFEACLSWAKNACQREGIDENVAENLREQLGECLHLIRFSSMNMDQFTTLTYPYKGLLTYEEITNIMYKISPPKDSSSLSKIPRYTIGLHTWNSNKTISWKCDETEEYRSIDSKETYLRFSVNSPVLLGMLNFDFSERCYGSYYQKYNFNYEIFEFRNNLSDRGERITIVERKHGSSDNTFESNIIIYPRKIYEIRTTLDENASNSYTRMRHYNSECKLNDETTITIENNGCFVSELHFQPI